LLPKYREIVKAGPLADLADGGALEAVLAEQGLGRLQQRLSADRGVPRPGGGRAGLHGPST
jgi:hypothetical protein